MSPLLIDSPPDLLLIVFVVMLMFGAKKLPDLARGSGRALRIFKSEVNGLNDDDETKQADPSEDPGAEQASERAASEARHEVEREGNADAT